MGTAMISGNPLDHLSLFRHAVLRAVELHPKHRNAVAKKRARQEDVDSDYLFANAQYPA